MGRDYFMSKHSRRKPGARRAPGHPQDDLGPRHRLELEMARAEVRSLATVDARCALCDTNLPRSRAVVIIKLTPEQVARAAWKMQPHVSFITLLCPACLDHPERDARLNTYLDQAIASGQGVAYDLGGYAPGEILTTGEPEEPPDV
jgi:hypothetical protein